MGLVIWEVVQLIPFHQRKNLFDRLVNDKEENVVQINPAIRDVAQLIVCLTKKRPQDRMENMREVTNRIKKWKAPEFKFYRIESIPRSFQEAGKILTAKNSLELVTCLIQAKPGSTINLLDADYAGYFVLNKEKITLIGRGSSILFKNHAKTQRNRLIVSGNYNNIWNIKFSSTTDNLSFALTGDNNHVNGVEFIGGQKGILVSGKENKLENVTATKCDSPIQIKGCNNLIDNVQFDSIDDCVIYVGTESEGNMIQNIFGINMKRGIWCDSKNNKFSGINFSKTLDYKCHVGVRFDRSGNSNTINDLICSNYADDEWDFVVYSSKSTGMNCTCNTVFVGGSEVTLTKVNCSNALIIGKKAAEAVLQNCGGNWLLAELPVIQKSCRFEIILNNRDI